jgi:hypothetical protein
MTNQPTFRRHNCKKNSAYIFRAEEELYVFRNIDMIDRDESRTYYCEHCKRINEIKLKGSQWTIIELATRK